jgi:hypothetical protein
MAENAAIKAKTRCQVEARAHLKWGIIRGAMEIDKDELLDMMLWTFGELGKLEAELIAYKVVFLLLKSSGQFPELEALLETTRLNPPPKLAVRHEEIRATIRRILDEGNADQALMKFLRNWKPKGPAN